jgi:hypothetical protein
MVSKTAWFARNSGEECCKGNYGEECCKGNYVEEFCKGIYGVTYATVLVV